MHTQCSVKAFNAASIWKTAAQTPPIGLSNYSSCFQNNLERICFYKAVCLCLEQLYFFIFMPKFGNYQHVLRQVNKPLDLDSPGNLLFQHKERVVNPGRRGSNLVFKKGSPFKRLLTVKFQIHAILGNLSLGESTHTGGCWGQNEEAERKRHFRQ